MDSEGAISPVAVIGADCILPKASDLESFYLATESCVDAIAPVPTDWWGEENLFDPDPFAPNKSYTDLAALLEGWELDRDRFKLPPRLLEAMDPVHALAMELTRRIVETVERQQPLQRDKTAVVIANMHGGARTALNLQLHLDSQKWAYRAMQTVPEASELIVDYEREVLRRHPSGQEEMSINSGSCTMGARISNYFGFRGPHYAVDGACASSTVALHSACIGLHQGAYEAALVGAFSRLLPEFHVVNSKARTLSAKGSFPFDERADGFVPAEGGIIVALMPLEAARETGHPIYGVIRSIGYSTNGRLTAPWVPSVEGEVLAVRRAFDGSDVDPSSIDYVEAHGTSTRLGDGVEFNCLSETYSRRPDEPPLPIGSVKSMIGHLVEGAGLAGLLRALFVFDRRKLPPTIGISEPREDLPFEKRGLRLQKNVEGVQVNGRPLRVGINCFGYGGVNYHVLMESGEAEPRQTSISSRAPLSSGLGIRQQPSAVAIVGMGAALPDAPDIPTFWKNIAAGRVSSQDLRRHIPLMDLFLESESRTPRGIYAQWVAAAEVPPTIDFARFRIMPNRAPSLTKDLLLLLQATSEAISSLNKELEGIDLARAGCIVGQLPDSDARGDGYSSINCQTWLKGLAKAIEGQVSSDRISEAENAIWQDPDLGLFHLNEDASVAGDGSLMASCVASGLDFRGKSFTVRAACATSLAAVTLAVQELRQHTLDFVLCGATSSGVGLANQVVLTDIQALSRQDRTQPYDRDADGFILGSGAVMLALKRLHDAERNGDQVLAVIRDVAGTSDGKGTSLLAPNVAGRELVLKRIYEEGPIPFDSVQYIEGHGAATAMGDETEVAAMNATRAGSAPLYLGSVKGNIGHLKAAAGMAGLAKAVLALRHEMIPPSTGTANPDPSLRLEARGIKTPPSTLSWPPPPNGPRRAAVNAFGLGGSNYHVLLEEPPPAAMSSSFVAGREEEVTALAWSAGSREQLAGQVRSCPSGSALGGAWRAAIVGTDAQLSGRRQRLLEALAEDDRSDLRDLPPGIYCNETGAAIDGKVCFLFPGQGGQYGGMIREIAAEEPEIAEAVKAAQAALEDELPDFQEGFWGDGSVPASESALRWLDHTANAQVACLLASHVLTRWLADRGIRGDFLLGHSVGELSALTVGGSVALDDSLRIACRRGRIAANTRNGQPQMMAALAGDEVKAQELVGEMPDVHVANLNSPRQIVISGTQAAVERAMIMAREQGLEGVALPIECAYHSPLLAEAVAPLRAELEQIDFCAPELPVYRSSTSQFYGEVDASDIRESLARLYTSRIDFMSMLRDAHSRGARVFIEVGPKRALMDLAGDILGRDGIELIPLLHPKGGEKLHLLRAAARLWTLGLTDVPPERAGDSIATSTFTPSECVAMKAEVRPTEAPAGDRDWRGRRVLLISDGSGLARKLAAHLANEGAEVDGLTVPEAVSDRGRDRYGKAVRVENLKEQLEAAALPNTVYFLPAFDRCVSGLGDSYEESLAAGTLAALREVARAYADGWEEGAPGELVAVTRMDGRSGHTVTPRGRIAGAALVGFLRALHHEMESLRTCLLDLHPLAPLESAADACLDVVSYEGRHVERGRFTDDWTESILLPACGGPEDLLEDGELPWKQGGEILVTGGARGVTALVARTMAAERAARFLLVGTTTPADADDPLLTATLDQLHDEKIRRFRTARKEQPRLTPASFERTWSPVVRGLEIVRNIGLLRSAGAEVEYMQVDLANPRSARAFSDRLRRDGRTIEVLVHGAGIEKSRRIQDANPRQWDNTFAVKAGGLHHLLHLVGPETRAVLVFASIAGVFGGPGQTDYSAANEYLSRFAYQLSASLPRARVTSVAWPPWEETGMAATRPTSRQFLESHGIRFMSPREGGKWALGALSSTRLEPELILLPPAPPARIHETRAVDLSVRSASSLAPALADAIIPLDEGGWVVRWRFDPEIHASLLEHQVAGKIRLPAAHLVEQIAEAVQAVEPDAHVLGLKDIEILGPVTLTADRPRDLFVELLPAEDQLTYRTRMWTHPVLPDGTLVPNRVEIARAMVIGGSAAREPTQIELSPRNLKEIAPETLAGEIEKRGIHYGPHFQGIRSLAEMPGFAYAAELRPVASTDISGEVFLDAALLDLALQTLGFVLIDSGIGLPTGFDRIDLHCQLSRSPARTAWALGKASDDPGVTLVDSDGIVLAEVHGLRIARPEDVQLARI